MAMTIVGVDCATQPQNVGLARGSFENGVARVDEVVIGTNDNHIVDTVSGWVSSTQGALLAMDAPLGWPAGLGEALSSHKAGDHIPGEANRLFRRETDRFIRCKFNKQPLDVGADRIARTAHAALDLLHEIRTKTGKAVPLAWEAGLFTGVLAIEVYPAATLIAHDMQAPGYKRKDGWEARRGLVGKLGARIELLRDTARMEEDDDALDAAICVLAGADFLRGDVYGPEHLELARQEGWIWVREKGVSR